MEEIKRNETEGQPNPEEKTFNQETEATTPAAAENNAFLEVKFNKETKKLTLEEATTLAQKGMKLDQISEELDILKKLSNEKGVGLKEFIRGLGEVKPSKTDELKALGFDVTEETVPEEVKTAAKLSGKGLVFEYLMYEYRKNLAEKNEAARQEKSRETSLGSVSSGGRQNTADAEFLRGVWG